MNPLKRPGPTWISYLRSRLLVGICLLLIATYSVIAVAPPATATARSGGDRLWLKRWNGPNDGVDFPSAVKASPDGSKVFVTGFTGTSDGYDDYGTVAYRSSNGAQLWGERYNGPGNLDDHAVALAVSPDATKVYVTGWSYNAAGVAEYATVAYEATTGARLWVERYGGPAGGGANATSIAVSPDGRWVFVTGEASVGGSTGDYGTVAYEASTGQQMWATLFTGMDGSGGVALSIAVSPGGSKLFVTGSSLGPSRTDDFTTVAYDSGIGTQLWVTQLNGPNDTSDYPASVVASPDGSKVFVTGTNLGGYVETAAYDATSGATLWGQRYGDGGPAAAYSLAVSPGGSRVYVAGYNFTATTGEDYATLAYDASTGHQVWAATYNGPAPGENEDLAYAVAVSPGGRKVLVTGFSLGNGTSVDFATVGYSASTGHQLWVSRYNGPSSGNDFATSIALSPGGQKVYVTGPSTGFAQYDYATIAYRA